MKTVKSLMVVLLIVAVTTTLSAQKKIDPTGTWTFKAEQAPYEYNSGDIVIGKDGNDYTAKIVFGEYYKIDASGVKYEKNELSFKVYIEGESVYVKGTVEKDEINGTASYSDGTISYNAKKKE